MNYYNIGQALAKNANLGQAALIGGAGGAGILGLSSALNSLFNKKNEDEDPWHVDLLASMLAGGLLGAGGGVAGQSVANYLGVPHGAPKPDLTNATIPGYEDAVENAIR